MFWFGYWLGFCVCWFGGADFGGVLQGSGRRSRRCARWGAIRTGLRRCRLHRRRRCLAIASAASSPPSSTTSRHASPSSAVPPSPPPPPPAPRSCSSPLRRLSRIARTRTTSSGDDTRASKGYRPDRRAQTTFHRKSKDLGRKNNDVD
ncbi:hypothetical protein Scep_027596 [Stephania cephalantha]|uniref:Uncharacterized protein n=1 Tax=Stephania cephalantha TaxID=152367 RepID=A0AAP0HIN1_9MAGN